MGYLVGAGVFYGRGQRMELIAGETVADNGAWSIARELEKRMRRAGS